MLMRLPHSNLLRLSHNKHGCNSLFSHRLSSRKRRLNLNHSHNRNRNQPNRNNLLKVLRSRNPQPQGYGAQGYGQAYNPAPQQPGQPYAQAQSASTDDTLRLIAFILAVISTVSVCWVIIPLAWMIPMTVHCWGIYKRKKANTTAFGVCTLIFLNLIGGILLLVSTRER